MENLSPLEMMMNDLDDPDYEENSEEDEEAIKKSLECDYKQ
ncbi:hypothetical protein A2U01_0086350, partial [Trifolium medium]|nr:hypothetical protein [Trifolium medium]